MPGKESDFPSRKERKAWKKQNKAMKNGGEHTLLPIAQSTSPYASRDASPSGYNNYTGRDVQDGRYDPHAGPGYGQVRSEPSYGA
jgi:hypothetical protein